MCGIVGYIGSQEAFPIVIKGLKRLEYRGYDSAGVALIDETLSVYKCKGKVNDLVEFASSSSTKGTIGMGHTRWATHGEPNNENAHPHYSQSKKLALVHNGIIENYAPLKAELQRRGHQFESDTDTEVLINLIEDVMDKQELSLEEAVRVALHEVTGAYAIVVMSKDEPDMLIGARKGSPLVVGVGHNEFFIASDATPIVEYTQRVVYLDEEEIVVIKRDGGLTIKNLGNELITPYVQELKLKLEMLEKGGYDHFMLKEIYEQPNSLRDCMRGRVNLEQNIITSGGIRLFESKLMDAKRIILLACGTSWHSALVGEYLFEDLARIPVEVEYASEFRYRNPIIYEDDIVIAISQSGETADTLAAMKLAKEKGATVLGVCNVVGSSIPRESQGGMYIHAGPEIGVASTKAFTSQVMALTLMAVMTARNKETISETYFTEFLKELNEIPNKVAQVLKETEKGIKYIAESIKDAENCLYLGRGYNFPVALEGALKLKEISYIHAEGYPAAEMKHGPIALIDEHMPVIVSATNQSAHEKVASNVQEVAARKGRVIAIVTKGEKLIADMAEFVIEVPDTLEPLSPLLGVVPLQLLSYHVALLRGCNVDQPRNLAKSVTVE